MRKKNNKRWGCVDVFSLLSDMAIVFLFWWKNIGHPSLTVFGRLHRSKSQVQVHHHQTNGKFSISLSLPHIHSFVHIFQYGVSSKWTLDKCVQMFNSSFVPYTFTNIFSLSLSLCNCINVHIRFFLLL